MERRELLKATPAALIAALPFLTASLAEAAEGDGWVTLAPGLQLKNLIKQGTAQGNLFRLGPDFKTRPHYHTEGEYTYVLKGSYTFVNGSTYKAGEYTYAPKGTIHSAGAAGPEGVELFVFTAAPVQNV